MGRMLETLKLGEGRRTPLALTKPTDATPVQECVVDWEIGAEVPFVEVGGPNKQVELSPALQRHVPQALPQPPHLPVEVAPKPAVYLTETKPLLTTAFEPWPAQGPTPLNVHADVIAFHQPEHAASKAYLGLLDTIRAGLKSDSANVLLLLGRKPNVGAGTVLLNLAVTAALARKLRVIVVDTRAGLAERLGHDTTVGLGEMLGGTLALSDAIVKTGIASLHLLPAGKPCTLSAGATAWLMACLRERYDLILVHGPTLEDAHAAAVHVPHANGIYVVLSQDEPATAAKEAAQTIQRQGGRLGGLIHTQFDV